MQDLAGWTAGSTGAGSQLQLSGQTALQYLISSANATSGDVYVFGGINSSVAPMANYFSTPHVGRQTAVDQAFETAFGFSPTDPAAATFRFGHAELPFRDVRGAVSRAVAWTTTRTGRRRRARTPAPRSRPARRYDLDSSTQRTTQPGFQELTQAYTMLARVRRLAAQRRRRSRPSPPPRHRSSRRAGFHHQRSGRSLARRSAQSPPPTIR